MKLKKQKIVALLLTLGLASSSCINPEFLKGKPEVPQNEENYCGGNPGPDTNPEEPQGFSRFLIEVKSGEVFHSVESDGISNVVLQARLRDSSAPQNSFKTYPKAAFKEIRFKANNHTYGRYLDKCLFYLEDIPETLSLNVTVRGNFILTESEDGSIDFSDLDQSQSGLRMDCYHGYHFLTPKPGDEDYPNVLNQSPENKIIWIRGNVDVFQKNVKREGKNQKITVLTGMGILHHSSWGSFGNAWAFEIQLSDQAFEQYRECGGPHLESFLGGDVNAWDTNAIKIHARGETLEIDSEDKHKIRVFRMDFLDDCRLAPEKTY